MESHYTKVALSALGVVAMLTNFTFAQKQQYISHVNQSGLFELLKAAAAAGREPPQYEVMGFPISAHQMSVLQSGGIEEQLLAPTRGHPAGTDALGRDLFARVVHGARTACVLGLGASFILVAIGVLLAALSLTIAAV